MIVFIWLNIYSFSYDCYFTVFYAFFNRSSLTLSVYSSSVLVFSIRTCLFFLFSHYSFNSLKAKVFDFSTLSYIFSLFFNMVISSSYSSSILNCSWFWFIRGYWELIVLRLIAYLIGVLLLLLFLSLKYYGIVMLVSTRYLFYLLVKGIICSTFDSVNLKFLLFEVFLSPFLKYCYSKVFLVVRGSCIEL